MEVQPDIQQRSALIAAAVWEPARAFRTPDGWAAADSAESQRLVSTARALTHLHLLLVIVIILCPPQADYVRRRVMRDCGVALPYASWLTLCPCSHLGNIQGVLDLLSNGFDDTAPVRAHLRPADTTATE
jgi:hypothetical protein